MRVFGIITAIFLAAPAVAQQSAYTWSPLVCHEVYGLKTIVDRMAEPTQVGALNNKPSDDILRRHGGSCFYNSNGVRGRQTHIGWIESNGWLIKLNRVNIGNDTWTWRPADIRRSSQWRLPKKCRHRNNVGIIDGIQVLGYVQKKRQRAPGCADWQLK